MLPLASPVPSPCTNICRMNPATGWCSGCWRTLAEIAAWSTMADDDKRHIWSLLPSRRAEHEDPRFEDFTVVTAEYRVGSLAGVIGVIGPTRMPYDKVISLVSHTSQLLSDLLE